MAREVSIRESESDGKTAVIGEFSCRVLCLLPALVQFVALLTVEVRFDFDNTRRLPLRVTLGFFPDLDVNNSGADTKAGRDGVGESTSVSTGSRKGVPFITLIELNEGESEGVGRPKSEKSVPRICLTSDDRRSLLRLVDSFEWRFLPSRGLVRERGSEAVLEKFLDSFVPRSDDWSDFPRRSKDCCSVAVLFAELEEAEEEPF